MAPKIFITGSTGYIGGSVLHAVTTQYPDADITVLLRNPPATFSTTYPHITIIRGTYDDTSLLTTTAQASDLVIHCGDSDHLPSLRALTTGLLSRPATEPGYLIHLSGTGILSNHNDASALGKPEPKIWSDVTNLPEIRALPKTALHAHTEALLHTTAREHGDRIRIAIMCPPDIYGTAPGPGRKQSVLLPMFVRESVKRGAAFFVEPGENARSWVHIRDLLRVYLRVVDAALARDEKWFNQNGYYFTGTQEVSQRELAERVGEVLFRRGKVESKEPRAVSVESLDNMPDYPTFPALGRYLFAGSSRSRPERAESWGYKGEADGLWEALEEEVDGALEGM